MKVWCLALALVLGWPTAEPPPRALEELRWDAEAAFRTGVGRASEEPGEARQCFACAAALYEKLRRAGAGNPELYRNLGNACLLASDPDDPESDGLPRAILAYRQGLRLVPSDRPLQRNLAYARQQVNRQTPGGFGLPPIDHRPPWLPRWPALFLYLALAGYSVGCLALARWWMLRRRGWLSAATSAFALLALCLAVFLLEAWLSRQEQRQPLVVVARDGLMLRVGNGSRYPARYDTALQRGVEATLRNVRGRWLQIELASGELGWVPRDAVLVDE